jgi:hypothetical protein
MLTNRAALLLVFAVSACGGAAAPGANPGGGPAQTPIPTPTPVPGDPGNGGNIGGGIGGGTDPGSGGGSGGNTGGGIVIPIPGDPNQNPLLGQANYVTPVKNLDQEHPINVQLVRAIVEDDGTVTADLRWWSGVAPCNQLAFVKAIQDDEAKTVEFQVIEGSAPGEIACIDIAELKATAVDLGTLASGTWTMSAVGDAPAIKLDVP